MKNTKYKSKRFLLPILLLVLVSILLIASMSTYITISMFKNHMNEHIEKTKSNYTQEHKNKVYKEVNFVKDSIKFQITKIENKLKISLKEKIKIAQNVASFTYNTYKNTHNKEQIKEKIANALAVIKFNDNRGYYFMYDNRTKVIFGHPMKKFIGRNMTNFRDIRGQSLMQLDTAALKKNKIGYSKIYFNKPNNQKEEFPKITCITKFEPLDLVLGIGEYLDVIEKRTKQYVLDRFSQTNAKEKDRYLVILDVHNMKGGDDFATVLLNSNRPELVGKKVSDKDKDIKGNRFRKDFLALVDEKGEGFSKYWYKKPSTNLPSLKISYFYLQKDWNWIIASGFYYEDLEEEIENMKELITTHTNNTINKTLAWVVFLSFLAIVIAIYVSFRIDKIINKYTNRIIEYENNKREQESLLVQQNKLASMGEMIGNIAHQWRQPLSVISTAATGIQAQKEYDILTDEKLNSSCNLINDNAQYLSKTIDDFRDFIKGDRRQVKFKLRDIVNSLLKLVEGNIKNHDIDMILDIQEDININGYPNELVQCLINIFNNAKDALKEQNIENKCIFISSTTTEHNATIKLKDNAGGIPKDIISKIFEPYFTTKHQSQGTGLGLSMSYSLVVEGMKGNIEANNITYMYKNKEYSGAEFVITLPLVAREEFEKA